MATDLERLVVQLSADIKGYENQMRRAQGITLRQTRAIESQWAKTNKAVASSFAGLGRSFAAVFAGGATLSGAQKLIDAATRIQNALKVAGLAGDQLTQVYDRLFASAQRSAAPLETLVELYSRAALQQKELGVSSEELLRFTDNVALALRVAGTDAQAASGALLQLSQALGSGVVRAEEFNSILEGAPTIAQAAAAGLKEAGGSVAALRKLVVDGKVSSEAFFRAFEAGAAILDDKLVGSEQTVSQALTRLQNVLIDTAGKFDDAVNASGAFADFIDGSVIPAIKELGSVFSGLGEGPIADFIGWMNAATDAVLQLSADIGKMSGLDQIGARMGAQPYIGQGRIQERIDAAFAGQSYSAPKSDRVPTDAGTIRNPASIERYPVTGSKKSGGKRENDYARELRQIQERTAAIRAETEAMAKLNPLVEDYGFGIEKARAVQELLTSAQRAGLAVTPELRAQIEGLAGGYAKASADAQKLAESQDEVRERAQEMAALGKDAMGGFISDLVQGKTAAEALAGALDKVGNKLLDIALDGLFGKKGGLFGGGKGGLLGGFLIPGILHSGGVAGKDGYGHGRAVSPSVFAGARRYHSGGVAGLAPGEVPAILQRGEVVIPKGMGSRAAAASPGPVSINVSIDGANGDAHVVALVRQGVSAGLQAYDKQLDRTIGGKVQNAQLRYG